MSLNGRKKSKQMSIISSYKLQYYCEHKDVGKRYLFAHCCGKKPRKINLFRHVGLSAKLSISPFMEIRNKEEYLCFCQERSFHQTDE
jgi:hypothetical protein